MQLVHYPIFAYVGPNEYLKFQAFHMNAITPLVAPLMICEIILCLMSLKYEVYKLSKTGLQIIIILILIWLSTAFVSVPLHEQLLAGKNNSIIQKLVFTNWIRTILWTVKLIILFTNFK